MIQNLAAEPTVGPYSAGGPHPAAIQTLQVMQGEGVACCELAKSYKRSTEGLDQLHIRP